jgi:hypothetical protein
MKSPKKLILASMLTFSLGGVLPVFAQDPNSASPPPSGGWRRFEPSNAADVPPEPPEYQGQTQSQAPPPPRYPAPPSRITIPAGTWIAVRVNEPLSSDHNQPGDYFTATLLQPIVANGRVIARRGQTVSGVVSEAKKAGRVEGLSRLGLELTEISLADGDQVQVRTKLMERHGDTSFGRDAVGIGAAVGTGAAIGAAVNGGVGAGVGAAAGVLVSTIGVMMTRGKPTVVYPETPLTFRLDSPLTVEASSDAFPPVSQQDYDDRGVRRQGPPSYGQRQGPPAYGYGYPPPPPYYNFYGGFGPYSGYFWSPGLNFYYGRGFRHRW